MLDQACLQSHDQGNYSNGDQQGQADNNNVAVADTDAMAVNRARNTSVAELGRNNPAVMSSAVA